MSCRFNIIVAITYRIDRILETMFKFMLSQVARPSRILVIYLIPIAMWQLEKELEKGRMNFIISSLKTLELSHFRRLTSDLFHSITVDEKNS